MEIQMRLQMRPLKIEVLLLKPNYHFYMMAFEVSLKLITELI